MATVIVKTETEATPALIAGLLKTYSDKLSGSKFPFDRGMYLFLKPETVASLHGAEDMPVIVLASSLGTPLGMIAMYQKTGEITVAYIVNEQVIGTWSPE